MRHEMLTQRALFCHHANTKRGTLTQHFVTHVVPPLTLMYEQQSQKVGKQILVSKIVGNQLGCKHRLKTLHVFNLCKLQLLS